MTLLLRYMYIYLRVFKTFSTEDVIIEYMYIYLRVLKRSVQKT